MASIPEALAMARQSYQAGDFSQAEYICRQILQVDSSHAETWFLLGSVSQGLGKAGEAVAHYQRALGLRPDYVEAYNSLGNALKAQGQFDEAVACYRHALHLRPDYATAYNNLGNALKAQGQLDEAVACYQRALELRPDYALASSNLGATLIEQGRLDEAVASLRHALRIMPTFVDSYNNIGVALKEQGKLDEAEAHLRQALRLKPDYAPAHNNLGTTLLKQGKPDEAVASFQSALQVHPDYLEARINLADALREQGQLDEAVASYRRALQLQPDCPEAYNGLGNALLELGRLDEAVASYQQAVRLRPGFADAYNGLGNALTEQGRLDEAVASYQQALHLRPGFAEVHSNMGNALTRQGKLDEAVASLEHALQLRPDDADAHFNRSLVWLLMGNFEQGWPEYEWRWKRKDAPPRPHRQPHWDGSALEGRTILLYAEQGSGDTLQFIRYAPLVKRRGGRVLMEVSGSLVPLLASCPGIDRLVAAGSTPPPFEVQAPLLALPRLFGTPPAPVPADVPYLFADDRLVERWRGELEPHHGFQVGIAWQGNPCYPGDRHRSIPLAQFAPLARGEGVRLFSLQKGPGTEQLRDVADRFPMIDLGSRLDETSGAFLDTAAVMKNLDLVVTCDTAIGHLAGALGVPVWVALPFTPDWCWMLGREDSPWYPTMRLFRQAEPGNWGAVFDRIAAELEKVLTTAARIRPIRVEVAPGELIDKISILEIKSQRIADPEKLRNIRVELAALVAARDRAMRQPPGLLALAAELKAVNETLWQVEDAIRLCERDRDFGPRFIELARSVYRQNDRRAAIKRQINELTGSKLIEEKAYTPYET